MFHLSQNYQKKPQRLSLQQGFTLLEVLVVLLLLGIILGFAGLSINQGDTERQMRQQLLQLQATLQFVQQEAILTSQAFGIGFSKTAYVLFRYQDDWQRIQTDPLLVKQSLPDGFLWSIHLEQQTQSLSSQTIELPQLLFLPSGEIQPPRFQIRLLAEQPQLPTYVLQQNENVQMEWFQDEN